MRMTINREHLAREEIEDVIVARTRQPENFGGGFGIDKETLEQDSLFNTRIWPKGWAPAFEAVHVGSSPAIRTVEEKVNDRREQMRPLVELLRLAEGHADKKKHELAESDPLEANYWQGRADGLRSIIPHVPPFMYWESDYYKTIPYKDAVEIRDQLKLLHTELKRLPYHVTTLLHDLMAFCANVEYDMGIRPEPLSVDEIRELFRNT